MLFCFTLLVAGFNLNLNLKFLLANPSQQRYDYFYSHANIFKEK